MNRCLLCNMECKIWVVTQERERARYQKGKARSWWWGMHSVNRKGGAGQLMRWRMEMEMMMMRRPLSTCSSSWSQVLLLVLVVCVHLYPSLGPRPLSLLFLFAKCNGISSPRLIFCSLCVVYCQVRHRVCVLFSVGLLLWVWLGPPPLHPLSFLLASHIVGSRQCQHPISIHYTFVRVQLFLTIHI